MFARYVPRNSFSAWHDPSYDVIGQILGGSGSWNFQGGRKKDGRKAIEKMMTIDRLTKKIFLKNRRGYITPPPLCRRGLNQGLSSQGVITLKAGVSVSKSTIWPQASYVRGAGAEGERSALSGDAKGTYRRGVCVCMSLMFDRLSNFYRIKWNSVQQCASGLPWKDWTHRGPHPPPSWKSVVIPQWENAWPPFHWFP